MNSPECIFVCQRIWALLVTARCTASAAPLFVWGLLQVSSRMQSVCIRMCLGVRFESGTYLEMNGKICEQLKNDDEVWVELEGEL